HAPPPPPLRRHRLRLGTRRSEVTSLCGHALPVVVLSIFVPDGRLRELNGRRIVQTGEAHSVELAHLRRLPTPERLHAAAAAEEVMDDPAPERVLRECFFPCSSRNAPALAMAFQNRCLKQMEQLHRLVPLAKSRSHSKRTAPQWQLPLWVRVIPPSYPLRSSRAKVEEALAVM